MAHETRGFNLEVVAALAPADGERILEVGFGHGSTLAAIAAKAPRAELAGIDLSVEAVGHAAGRCKMGVVEGRIDLRAGDSAHLPWGDASFDKAFSVHTIYFWADPLQNLRELWRVLRPDGRLFLGCRERSAAATASFPASVYRFYSDDELTTLVRGAGFHGVQLNQAVAGNGDLRVVSAQKPTG
jgi:ubiquinone/menaquinone biosynthesis C-methylase UbiE